MKQLSLLAIATITVIAIPLKAHGGWLDDLAEGANRIRRENLEEKSKIQAQEAMNYGTRYNYEPLPDGADGWSIAKSTEGFTFLPLGDSETDYHVENNIYGFCVTLTGRKAEPDEQAMEDFIPYHYAVSEYGHGPDWQGDGQPTCRTNRIELFDVNAEEVSDL